MIDYILVFIGAGIGGSLRLGVNTTCARFCGVEFPWGTLAINILGSTVMGVAAAWFALKASEPWSQQARLFATTGILGGFTTFSAYSLDAVALWERGAYGSAVFYTVGSVVFAIIGLVIGLAIVRASA